MIDLQSTIEKAKLLFQANDAGAAINLLESVIPNNTTNIDVYHLLGIFSSSLQQYDKANRYFKKALKINNNIYQVHSNYGLSFLHQGDYKRAISSFKRALTLNGQHLDSHINMAAACIHVSDYNRAIKHAEAGINTPIAHIAHNLAGIAYKRSGQTQLAIKQFKQSIACNNQFIDAYKNLADTYLSINAFDEAESCLLQAVQLLNSADSYINLGKYYEARSNTSTAIDIYKKAHGLYPADNKIQSSLGKMYILADNSSKGLQYINDVLSRSPQDISATTDLCNYLIYSKSYNEAYDISHALFNNSKPCHDSIYFLLTHAMACKFSKHDNEAIICLNQASKLQTDDADAMRGVHYQLGDIYDNKKQFDRAFKHYRIANDLVKSRTDLQYYLDVMREIRTYFTQEIIDSLPISDSTDTSPVFILGMPRSGTSLVEQILSCHPDVHAAGETTALWQIGSDICQARNLIDYTRRIGTITKEHLSQYANEYLNSHNMTSGRVTDKLPHNFIHIALIQLLFPKAHIIHCQRHPFDNCLSIYFKNFNDSHKYCRNLEEVAQFYKEYMLLMQHWNNVSRISIYNLQYETLVSNQEQQTRALVEYIGLPWNDSCLRYYESSRLIFTPSFHQANQPVYSKSINRWKNYSNHISALTSVLGEPDNYI